MPIVKSVHHVDGHTVDIFVEVEDVDVPGAGTYHYGETRSTGRGAVTAVGDLFGDAMELVQRCAASAVQRINSLHVEKPTEVELQLAIKLSAQAGAVLTKLGSEAQLQVTLTWNRNKN